jgi:stage II sporulation protein D
VRFFLKYILVVTVVIILVPASIVWLWGWPTPPPLSLDSPVDVTLFISSTGQLLVLPLEEYVAGVVAAEMPALFSSSALEAQAVAGRTYVIRRLREFGGAGCSRNPLADVCDDPGHCQAFHPEEIWHTKWGFVDLRENARRIKNAVARTAGFILTYRGAVIDPIFHSTCGGLTEDADRVWSNSFPYLVSVECGYCQHSHRFTESTILTPEVLVETIKSRDGSISVLAKDFAGSSMPLKIITRSPSGRVMEVQVGDKIIKGTELRSILGLNSTIFEISLRPEGIVFTTTGYGHGVGMCQYGADGMAKARKDFRQILEHYYQGAAIVHIGGN